MARVVPPADELRTQSATRSSREGPTTEGSAAIALREGPLEEGSRPFVDSSVSEETTEPWAVGACRFDVSQEEWQLLLQAPLVGFLLVAATDGQVHPWERRALRRALKEGRRSPSRVLRLACIELFRKRNLLMGELASFEPRRELLTEAYRLVDRKLGREEAERFKQGLLVLGRRVAAGCGGLLASWGWLPRAEREALDVLATLLDAG